jgi:hypothetical protein
VKFSRWTSLYGGSGAMDNLGLEMGIEIKRGAWLPVGVSRR